jgi:prepilin-type N-terminal cleavage/methylation domain-containing protein
MTRQRGFSFVELIVVLAVLSLLAAMAIPQFSRWIESTQYRVAAREIASAMRESRSRAIQTNLQHRLELDLAEKRWRILHGNRAASSSPNSWESNVVRDWQPVRGRIQLKANKDCSVTAETVRIVFNPAGTSNARYICVCDTEGAIRFQVAVPYSITGRVVVK